MFSLGVLLVLTASLPSSSAWLHVLGDSSNCVHLQCEWRGVGEQCESDGKVRERGEKEISPNPYSQEKQPPEAYPVSQMSHSEESEESYLTRVKVRMLQGRDMNGKGMVTG